MIEVLAPLPPSKLLTTVDKVKAYLKIANNDSDEIITDMIAAASDFAVNYCGREFAKQTVKESLVGKGVPDLILSNTPIITLEKVEYDTSVMDDCIILDKAAGFIQRRMGFYSTEFLSGAFDRAPSSYAEKRWHVTYTAGYVLPGWPTDPHGARTLPYDLERAIQSMCVSQFKNMGIDGTIKTYKIGDTSITWDRASNDGSLASLVPGSALAVLNYYKRAY